MSLLDQLKAEGIQLRRVSIGNHHVDCPKPYCQKSRPEADKDCLHLEIEGNHYAEWKCRHCLWTGHIGAKKPKKAPAADTGKHTFLGLDDVKIVPGAMDVIIVSRAEDKAILDDCQLTNVLALPYMPDDPRDKSDRFGYLADAVDVFRAASRVLLAFDSDDAGQSLMKEVSRRVGPGKCWIVTPLDGTIQRTMLEHSSDDVCADIREAKPLPICGLFEISDFEKELFHYFDHGMGSGVSTGWQNVDTLYTVVTKQLTVVTGIPNSGKSEWVDALTVNLALERGWRFGMFSPENGKEVHATKLIEKRVELSADPRSDQRMNFDTFYSGSKWVAEHYSFIESTQMLPTLDWILERAQDAVLRHGIKGLVIDPWNRIAKKLGERQSETDYVGEALPKILQFLQNYDVHGWLIVHPKQQQPDQKTKKISAPSLYDMAGSAHFVNMCDNGIVIHRSDSVDDTTEVHVKKIRFKHVGRRGLTKLSYNLISGRYTPLDDSPTYAFNGEKKDGITTYEPGDI